MNSLPKQIYNFKNSKINLSIHNKKEVANDLTNLTLILDSNKETLSIYTQNRLCGLAVELIAPILEQKGWKVQIIKYIINDYYELAFGSENLTMFHYYLVGHKNNRYYLIDPTIGQFLGSANYFVHEITGHHKNSCLSELQELNLPEQILHDFVQTITSPEYQ